MNKDDGVYVDGQGVQLPENPVSLMATNEDLQRVGASEISGFASTKIKNMVSDPGFRSGDGFVTEQEINKRYNLTKDPYWTERTGRTSFDELKIKSDTTTIIKDELSKFAMSFQTLGDKAQIALGGLAALASNNKIGAEMRDRAYDSIDAAMKRINVENTHAADAETLTAQVTQGAASMLEMFATGLMTGGVAPLAQMGVEAMGDGTYNNMIKYAKDHEGSIEGYEGSWLETGIDLLNATAQVGIERWKGLGSAKFFKGMRGSFLKETVNGFVQESSQDFLTDLAEYLKGNGDVPTNWEQYMMSGIIGGFLQGALGAATYKYGRTQADNEMSDLIFKATKARHPEKDDAELYKESRAQAVAFNDAVETGVVQNTWDELANRIDANNDRGVIRDNLVKEFTKARVAALGLESAEELDAEDLADIQDAATIATGEAFRESFIKGISIFDTMTARLTADGKDLVVRDLKPSEQGVQEKATVDLLSEQEKLAQEMGVERERRAIKNLQEQLAQQQEQAVAEKQQRAAELKEIEAWATEQAKKGTQAQKVMVSETTRARDEARTEKAKNASEDVALVKKLQKQVKDKTKKVLEKLKEKGIEVNARTKDGEIYVSNDSSSYLFVKDPDGITRKIRISYETGKKGTSTDSSFYGDMSVDDIVNGILARFGAKRGEEIKHIGAPEVNPYQELFSRRPQQLSLKNIAQGLTSGRGRGAYDMRYQRIILNKDSDISTILHELSHMWLNNWFKAYRSENAPESFKKWWRPVERALGIRESDRFLDRDASEKFARAFEKWVLDGGKGAEESLNPVFDRLSKRLADIYDDLATRYFDMVGELKPEVQSWFAKNEVLADSMVVDVPEKNEETGETTVEKVQVQYRDRAAERETAQKMAKEEDVAQRVVDREADEINDIVENTAPTPLAQGTDETAKSPYTAEGQKEQRTSKRIVESAKADGVLLESRKYDPLMSKRAAEDAVVFASADLDSAFEVAMGRKNAPGDVPRIAVFFAVQNKLMLNPVENAARLQELALNSPVIEELSRAGQQLRMAGVALSKDSPMRILRDLSKMYDENLTDAERASITENINKINDYIARADLNTEDVWNKILSDMECK